jgi:hypothetical protein
VSEVRYSRFDIESGFPPVDIVLDESPFAYQAFDFRPTDAVDRFRAVEFPVELAKPHLLSRPKTQAR